eukprot:TRINITY_DN74796_c0_g1_i1.p1 TRINITY_DN74796_c0_g1~~TRINITY_DN74796_c0_g1_i1.p1  ORF type:complete len:590 (+),score=141.66 TRINITY_DN74796_c0_g1_i1:115-1884(+)
MSDTEAQVDPGVHVSAGPGGDLGDGSILGTPAATGRVYNGDRKPADFGAFDEVNDYSRNDMICDDDDDEDDDDDDRGYSRKPADIGLQMGHSGGLGPYGGGYTVSMRYGERIMKGQQTGTLKKLFREKGFGFVAPDDGHSADVFLHFSDLANGGSEDMVMGMRVTFEGELDPRSGKVRARHAVIAHNGLTPSQAALAAARKVGAGPGMLGASLPRRPDPKRRPRTGSEDGPVTVVVPRESVPDDEPGAYCRADILETMTALKTTGQLERKPQHLKICTIYVPWKLDEEEHEERERQAAAAANAVAAQQRPLEDPRLDDEARICALEARLSRESGADRYNNETFGDCGSGWSFEEAVVANTEICERRAASFAQAQAAQWMHVQQQLNMQLHRQFTTPAQRQAAAVAAASLYPQAYLKQPAVQPTAQAGISSTVAQPAPAGAIAPMEDYPDLPFSFEDEEEGGEEEATRSRLSQARSMPASSSSTAAPSNGEKATPASGAAAAEPPADMAAAAPQEWTSQEGQGQGSGSPLLVLTKSTEDPTAASPATEESDSAASESTRSAKKEEEFAREAKSELIPESKMKEMPGFAHQ